jgi:HEAT repeat protein
MTIVLFLFFGLQTESLDELFRQLSGGSPESRAGIRRMIITRAGARQAVEKRLKTESDMALREQLRLVLREMDKEEERRRLQQALADATARGYRALVERATSDDPKEVLELVDDVLPGYFADPTKAEFRIVLRSILSRPEAGGEWDAVRIRCLSLLRRGEPDDESVKLAQAQLNSRNAQVQIEALRALQTFEAAGAVPDIALLLTDGRAPLRLEALVTLRILRGAAAADAVASLLSDPEPRIRQEAAAALGHFGAKKHAGAIADRLGDGIAEVRSACLAALGVLKAAEFLARIEAALEDPVAAVQSEAVKALAELGSRASAAKIATLLKHERLREVCLEALGVLGDASTAAAIVEQLKDAHPRVRAAAISALARLGARGHAERIVESLEDPDPWVRREAIIALCQLKASDGLKEVVRLLKADRDPMVLIAAIRSLGELGARDLAAEATPFTRGDLILERLQDPAVNATWSDLIRATAVDTLGKLRATGEAEAVLALVEERSVMVRRAVGRSLAKVCGTSKKEALIALLSDPEPAVAFEAALALGELYAPKLHEKLTANFELVQPRDSVPNILAAARATLGVTFESREILLAGIQVTLPAPATLEALFYAVASERRHDLGVVLAESRGVIRLSPLNLAVRELTEWLRGLK